MPPAEPSKVIVHPIVLLSAVDHYNRIAKDTNKRVVGVLLGENVKGTVDVVSSYAVPFDEDEKNPKLFFFDHNYHENMFAMLRRVTNKEHIIGWYSSGPRVKESDIMIHEILKSYCPHPVFVVIDVRPEESILPCTAYVSKEEVPEDGQARPRQTFVHIPSEIGAYEAEEVTVEHLLRDVKDSNISSLAQRVAEKVTSLNGLADRMSEISKYLELVLAGEKLPNHKILSNLQNIFNLLPNMREDDMAEEFATKINDMMLVIYLSSMIRAINALHSLVDNQLEFNLRGSDKEKKEKEKEKKEKEKDKGKGTEGDSDKEKEKEESKGEKEKKA